MRRIFEFMPNIAAVILDYGAVLCHMPTPAEGQRMADLFGIHVDAVPELWMRNRLAFDRGDLTAEAYWKLFAEDAGSKIDARSLEEVYRLDLEMWARDNEAMIEWVRALRAGEYKVGLLSNMHADMVTYVRKKFAWVNEFDFQTFSADVRMVKPDAAIYEYTLRGLGVRPEESLFIDDREGNIDAARAVGMNAIQFASVDQLREELIAMDFPILPRQIAAGQTASGQTTPACS
jgi:putative hydrolase of the HAD superfamily